MPVQINLDHAIIKWQVRHMQRMSYSELARRAGITIQTLNRLRSGETIAPDLRKINEICKVLECEPGEIIVRDETRDVEKSKSSKEVYSKLDEFASAAIEEKIKQAAIKKYVATYKNWIVKEEYPDKVDILIIRSGASLTNPEPDDVQYLSGDYAEEWRRQNPSELKSRR